MIKQSKELAQFYSAYHQWVLAGAKAQDVFHRDTGLCSNLSSWVRSPSKFRLLFELYEQFEKAKLRTRFPFNDYSWEYYNEADANETHLNPRRIAWVKEHL